MKKTWSLSTTVRNPERILPFLKVLKEIEGESFDEKWQEKFQILLIQNRLYKPTGLDNQKLNYYETSEDKMSFPQAEEIFKHMVDRSNELKNDRGLRGRTSVAPLTKMWLAIAKKTMGGVKITELWNAFLEWKVDIGDVYFRFFLKWQIPNPDSNDYKAEDGYNINPFIGVLHLINQVNQKSIEIGEKDKGLSKQEFSIFGPTLVNFEDIEQYAEQIIELRKQQKDKDKKEQKEIFEQYKENFAKEFLETTDNVEIEKLLNNLKDYWDNAIRYFRLTRFIHIRWGGFYVDLEPRRQIEIQNLLKFDNAQAKDFEDQEEYLNYMADISKPILPWETKEEYIKIISNIIEDIKDYETKLEITAKEILKYQDFNENQLKDYIPELRNYRRYLQNQENHKKSQEVEEINKYIEQLEKIYDFEDRPILLEKLSSLGLNALNDALGIKPNYPVGDDNEPTFTAPANTPDIECYYEDFNAICEVTMLSSRDQRYNEGQPVMRHLRDFESKNNDKKAYCLFIAPTIHRDTLNTFWAAIKYEYEGQKQNIIPLTINNFTQLLKILVEIKKSGNFLKHQEIALLYDEIIKTSNSFADSNERLNNIPNTINTWQKSFTL